MTAARRMDDGLASAVEVVSRRSGLDFAGCHRDRMVDLVARAAHDSGARTAAEYVDLLLHEPDLYRALVDRLTIGETYFFRDPAQIDLVRSIARSWAGTTASRRIWSAGCASGEEPYSVAMVLEEEGQLARSQILGTDLSEAALDRAHAATYGPWSLRRCDTAQRRRHFQERAGRFRPHQRYVDAVELRPANLVEGPPAGGPFDLVLCRNVLIYLSDEAQQQAAHTLLDALGPGGWLILGASDPLPAIEGLEVVRTDHGIAHRRVTTTAPAPPLAPASTVRALRHRPDRADDGGSSPRPSRGQRRGAPGAVTSSQPDRGPAGATATPADAGEAPDPAPLLPAAQAADPVDASLRVLDAVLHLGAGRTAEAAAAASAAIYLEPDLAVAHLVLGRAHHLAGDADRARRSFRNALDLLSALPPDAEVPLADGERAGPLAATAAVLAGV